MAPAFEDARDRARDIAMDGASRFHRIEGDEFALLVPVEAHGDVVGDGAHDAVPSGWTFLDGREYKT